jgi:protein-S-isoprenylcysteine O-methyltransferase Ste14
VIVAFRVLAWLSFLAAFGYLVPFLAGVPQLPKTVDSGAAASLPLGIAIDLALVAAFGVPHSLLARARFKKPLPPSLVRSLYVAQSSLLLGLLMWQWRPLTQPIWIVEGAAAWALYGLCGLGWAIALYSTFLIDHFAFVGLRVGGEERFATPSLYSLVRHPMMLGVLTGIWATPRMTLGHLVFCAGMTVYVAIGVRLEERDLARTLGEDYQRYRASVPMLLPWPRPRQNMR